MNGIALQLSASAIALGLMGSAVGVHYFKVQEGIAGSPDEGLYEGLSLVSHEIPVAPFSGEGRTASVALEGEGVSGKGEKETHLELLQQMVRKLEELNDENQRLREETEILTEQVAETNRDLSQLQFRVDTHSESFRPLRVGEEHTFQKALPVTPSVLPPKNW